LTERSVKQNKPMSPKVIDKQRKKNEILQAAMQVFAEKGVKSARIADIAQRAGVGKGTIYEYFRSRDEMFVGGFNLLIEDLENRLQAEMETPTDPESKLRSIMRVFFSSLRQLSAEMTAIFIDFWSEGIRTETTKGGGLIDLKQVYADVRKQLQQVLSDGIMAGQFREVNTEVVASTMMAIVDGLLLQWILVKGAFALESAMEGSIDMVLNGIKV
jgi:AcrR family transcriptional regulator